MTPAAELRLLRRLSAPGVLLVRHGESGWAAYPNGDRRRRPLLRLDDNAMRDLVAAGIVSSGGARALTEDGRSRLARLRAGESGFVAQHATLAPAPATAPGAARNLEESPLARLVRAGDGGLEWQEIEAGERLRADLVASTWNTRVTMDWSAPPARKGAARAGRDPGGAADAALAARERVNAALAAVGEPFATALLDFLWREIPLQTMEQARKWPRRSGRLGLKLALAALARHYGIVARKAPSGSA